VFAHISYNTTHKISSLGRAQQQSRPFCGLLFLQKRQTSTQPFTHVRVPGFTYILFIICGLLSKRSVPVLLPVFALFSRLGKAISRKNIRRIFR
jgi:hypothetical protein